MAGVSGSESGALLQLLLFCLKVRAISIGAFVFFVVCLALRAGRSMHVSLAVSIGLHIALHMRYTRGRKSGRGDDGVLP